MAILSALFSSNRDIEALLGVEGSLPREILELRHCTIESLRSLVFVGGSGHAFPSAGTKQNDFVALKAGTCSERLETLLPTSGD
jgi:hypothetical protein